MITDYVGSGGNVIIPKEIFGLPVTEFDGEVFDVYDQALTSIEILAEVTEIPDYFADNIDGLKEVIIPYGVVRIGQCAFDGYENLKSVQIPDSVEEIGWRAFYYTTSLKEITLPKSLKSMEANVF